MANRLEKWVNKVHCMDCLEGMKQLPDGCVDLVVTDPQYNKGKDYGEMVNDNLSPEKYWAWYKLVAKELFRVCGNGHLYISCSQDQLWDVRPIHESIGWKYIQFITWYGPNLVAGTARYNFPWSPMSEPILLFRKGKRVPMINPHLTDQWSTADVQIHSRPQRNFSNELKRVHPTQKPLSLYRSIIARTPSDLILDPFMGSGTTAVACKQLGRQFIGFEINPDYVKICNQRLKQEELFNA